MALFSNSRNHFIAGAANLFPRAVFSGLFVILPVFVYAVDGGIADFIVQIENILNVIIPFLVGLAVFIIIYGILGYISSAADEEKRKQARDFIMWGVLGVFAMLSVWGFVVILVNSFNLDTSTTVVTDIYGQPVDVSDLEVPTTVPEFIDRAIAIGSHVIPFLVGIGVFIVLFGIINYIRQGDNEEKRAEGRRFIIWGIISIFIMLSIWGLVNILVKSFELDKVGPTIPDLPNLPVTEATPDRQSG
ncbi:MAG: hypothetical protein HYV67_01905 [Candidatus Taylorbacteria bacterium]|nr:hypothetical protein [Candidatus Taylorbacteria bacterium]